MRRAFLLWAVLALLVLVPHGQVRAQQSAIDPARFVLPVSDFPPQTTVYLSQVESNEAATADPLTLHWGTISFASGGRVSGYTMQTSAPSPSPDGHPILTWYLVSLYRTAAAAQSAWQGQHDGWLSVEPAGGTCGGIGAPGDTQNGCANSYLTSTHQVSELYFTRGPVFVEVFQAAVKDDVTSCFQACVAPVLPFLHSVAEHLDGIAVGIVNAPTFTPTSTATSRPTVTPIPTATPIPPNLRAPSRTIKGALLYTTGSGNHTTPTFNAPASWSLDWRYACSASGAFIVDVLTAKGSATPNQSLHRSGTRGHGVVRYTHGGVLSLKIRSKCAWYVIAKR